MKTKQLATLALLYMLPTTGFADLTLLYGESSVSETTIGVEEIYTGLPETSGSHIVAIENRPIELASLFTLLDSKRVVAPPKIKTYSPDLPDDVPASAENILDFIAQFEAAPAGYNSVWAGNKTPLPQLPTKMTVCEIKDWQSIAARRQKSTAIGRYQIISETFLRISNQLNLQCDTLFGEEIQDQMAMALLIDAGWTQFVGGHSSSSKFGHSLAGVWAAFPATSGIDKGKSRYWRVAGNKSLIALPDYLEALARIRENHNRKERRVLADAL